MKLRLRQLPRPNSDPKTTAKSTRITPVCSTNTGRHIHVQIVAALPNTGSILGYGCALIGLSRAPKNTHQNINKSALLPSLAPFECMSRRPRRTRETRWPCGCGSYYCCGFGKSSERIAVYILHCCRAVSHPTIWKQK